MLAFCWLMNFKRLNVQICPTEVVSERKVFILLTPNVTIATSGLSSNWTIHISLLTPAGSLLSPVGNKTSYPRLKWVKEKSSSEQVKVMISGEVHLCFLRYPFLDDSFCPLWCIIFSDSFLIVVSWITGDTPAVGYFFVRREWLTCYRIL